MSSTHIHKPKSCPQPKLRKSLFFASYKMFKEYFTSHIEIGRNIEVCVQTYNLQVVHFSEIHMWSWGMLTASTEQILLPLFLFYGKWWHAQTSNYVHNFKVWPKLHEKEAA